jgi:TonB family protein
MCIGLYRVQKRTHSSEPPRTITVVFEQAFPLEVPPGESPGQSGRQRENGANSSEDSQISYQPKTLGGVEVEEINTPMPEFPSETNLLPTHPLSCGGNLAGNGLAVAGSGRGGRSNNRGNGGEEVGQFLGRGKGLPTTLEAMTILHQEVPPYPAKARMEKLEGEVIIELIINEKGIPLSAEIVQSTNEVFSPVAQQAAFEWRFTPVLFHGEKVRANFRICYRFILESVDYRSH